MRFLYFFGFALILYNCSTSSKNSKGNENTIQLETLNQTADSFAQTITSSDLNNLLSILASDEFEGRETAMLGQKKAAEFIANFFKENNIQPGANGSYFQSFPVDRKDPSKIDVKLNDSALVFLEDYFYLGNIIDTSFQTKIVDVGYGIKDSLRNDYLNKEVKNKVVLIHYGVPEQDNFSYWENKRNKIKLAKELGVAGIIFSYPKDKFNTQLERVKLFIEQPKMQMHNKGFPRSKEIPVIYLSDDNDSKEGNTIFIKTSTNQKLTSENVLGYIEGTDLKDELVVITAHYDHLGYDNGEICNGADDDGSGTVSVLEIAQAFQIAKEKGNGPRRSILFMTVSGEEKGLWGSKYYTDNPIYPLENTVVDLNIDMVGRIDEHHQDANYIYLIGSDRISKDLDIICKKVNNKYTHLNLDYTYNMPDDPNQFYYRSDHYNFAKNEIPVVFFFSGVHEDYHKPTDDVEKIDFQKLQTTARLVFYTAWEIANRTERLPKNALNN